MPHSSSYFTSKCISYLTIESKKLPPKELRFKIGDWFFGCDLCQTACPWNQKVFKNKITAASRIELTFENDLKLQEEFRILLTSSHNQILKKIKGSPLARTGAKGLKRNALVVIANRKMTNLIPEVQALIDDEYLGELAQWTLEQLIER
jgi:epoxyqueuosine reductase